MINPGLLNSLTDAERLLVAEAEPGAMRQLDEDGLLDLHQRVRRVRTKYTKNYRRGASAAVAPAGGRGMSYATNQRDRGKAEVFESVLARVSREVAAVARRASEELRAERIAAARSTRAAQPTAKPTTAVASTSSGQVRPGAVKTTGGLKKDASTRAAGVRRQAKRDSRSPER
jgi:hypothetical protein